MISALSAQDFVVFDAVALTLGPGLNVISGGSGEGKSLLLQALRFACGEGGGGRAAAERWVRPGADGCRVEVTVEVWPGLRERLGLSAGDGPLRVARALSREGRSRCSIDGASASLQDLRRVGDAVVEVFGQGTAAGFTGPHRQRATLDAYAGLTERSDAYRARRAEAQELAGEARRLADLEERVRAGWAEGQSEREALAELAPEAGEFGELGQALARLEQRAAERTAVAGLVTRLAGGDGSTPAGLLDRLLEVGRQLERLEPQWPELRAAAEAVGEASALVDDAAARVRDACGEGPEGGETLADLRERVQAFRALARRLRLAPEALAGRWAELQAEGDPEALAERRAAVEARLAKRRRALHAEARGLFEERAAAAARLAAEVSRSLAPLGLSGARLEVAVEALPVTASDLPGPDGVDRVAMRFAAGGGAPAPLEQASGGELSRVALALTARVAGGRAVLVFDEVDQNVGARLGSAVGACLADLARQRQVLAITHLAPVAARAARHVRIVRDGERTTAATLEGQRRLEELALMIRGEPITEAALEQARELLVEAADADRPTHPPAGRRRARAKADPPPKRRRKGSRKQVA